MPTAMCPDDLQTLGPVNTYGGRMTAHPKIDPVSGEMLWFAYAVGQTPLSPDMSFGVTNTQGQVVRRDDFEAPYCSMVHDFMVTDRHIVFPVLPLAGSLERALRGGAPFAWEPEKGAWIGVMRRDAQVSAIRWFEIEPCYVYHVANAWEVDGRIFCDVMRFDSAPLFPKADGSLSDNPTARLVRWTIDPGAPTNAVSEEVLDDLSAEFPRVDPRAETRAHRHMWYIGDPTGSAAFPFRAIAHLDLLNCRRRMYELPDGDISSEAVFAPRGPDAPEGEGWLMAVVWRAAENRSDFVIFEALDVDKGPIAVARVPRRVPFGFHGSWVAQ